MNVNPYHGVIDDKLASLHREMASLRVECDRLINKQLQVDETLNQNSALCPNDTSSAYNTGGESCRSNSITPDQSPLDCMACNSPGTSKSPRMLHRSQPILQLNQYAAEEPRSVDIRLKTPGYAEEDACSSSRLHIPLTQRLRRTSVQHFLKKKNPFSKSPMLQPPRDRSRDTPVRLSPKNSTYSIGAKKFTPLKFASKKDTMEYAKRFRVPSLSIVLKDQSKGKEQNDKEVTMDPAVPMPRTFCSVKPREKLYLFDKPVEEVLDQEEESREQKLQPVEPEPKEEPTIYKWKVKRRCDGTRYVVKRPIRSQILKKREAQLLKERTILSTDDDANSGIKLGYFHPREERKRHLEKERLRKEKSKARQMEAVFDSNQLIKELHQKKNEKKNDEMLLDEFATTQEVLSQRNISNAQGKNGILSVTTV